MCPGAGGARSHDLVTARVSSTVLAELQTHSGQEGAAVLSPLSSPAGDKSCRLGSQVGCEVKEQLASGCILHRRRDVKEMRWAVRNKRGHILD